MSQPKRKSSAFRGAIAAALASLIPVELTPPGNEAHAPARAIAARAPASAPPPSRHVRPTLSSDRPHVSYFNRELLDIPVVQDLYRTLKTKLPPGETSELAAIYVSEGPVRRSHPDFLRFMTALHADIRARSGELYELLESQDAVLKEDPFVYQMALNLAFQLNVPVERKARLLGNAMNIRFARDDQGGVSLMTANITNALILMKSSGVTLEQALPYIRQGLAVNSDDPEARREFIARANAYYPGAI